MKYNEAIDMILDGGETYRKGKPEYKQTFRWCDNFCGHYLHKLSGGSWEYGFIIDKEDFIANDWIVEKDGVVYETKPNGTSALEDVYESYKKLYNVINKKWQDFVRDYAEEQERKTSQIIADEVNEDWIEKKMLCFIRRREQYYRDDSESLRVMMSSKCYEPSCPFCFPVDKKETGINPKDYPCLANPKDTKNERIADVRKTTEKPRERVAVEQMLEIINYLANCQYTRGKYDFPRIPVAEIKEEQFGELKQKLEYLVSLQEKE